MPSYTFDLRNIDAFMKIFCSYDVSSDYSRVRDELLLVPHFDPLDCHNRINSIRNNIVALCQNYECLMGHITRIPSDEKTKLFVASLNKLDDISKKYISYEIFNLINKYLVAYPTLLTTRGFLKTNMVDCINNYIWQLYDFKIIFSDNQYFYHKNVCLECN